MRVFWRGLEWVYLRKSRDLITYSYNSQMALKLVAKKTWIDLCLISHLRPLLWIDGDSSQLIARQPWMPRQYFGRSTPIRS
jgi:hypothetical protein